MNNKNNSYKLLAVFILLCFGGCAAGVGGIVGGGGYSIDDTYNTAKSFYEQGNYSEAKKYYKRFADANPDSPLHEITSYYLAECYRKTGDEGNALATYQKVINKYQKGFWVDLARREVDNINSSRTK